MQMHPCLLDDKSMTAWEDHATEQTFKGVIEVIGQTLSHTTATSFQAPRARGRLFLTHTPSDFASLNL